MAQSNLEVRLVRDGPFVIVVLLESRMKHALWSKGEIDPGSANNGEDLRHKVGVLAGALAEYQGANYGDNHDPDECYKIARELFDEVFGELAQKQADLEAMGVTAFTLSAKSK